MDHFESVDLARLAYAARGVGAGLFIGLLLAGYEGRARLSSLSRRVLLAAAMALAGAGLAVCTYRIATNFLEPRDWDFLCYWSYGRALAIGQSPYDVGALREIAAPLSPSAEFLRMNYCCYPPVCLPLFWPFGEMPFLPSLAVWYAVQIASAGACALLLWRLWDVERTWLGLAVMLAVMLTWNPIFSTMFYAQSHFLLMLAILIVSAPGTETQRGIGLGLATIIKPIAAILVIDLALRRQWRTLLVAGGALLISLTLFLLAQGWAGLVYYKDRNPIAGDIAFQFYVEPVNQSLLAVLLRWYEAPPHAQPIWFVPFVISAGLLTAITVVTLWRLPRRLASLGLGYVLSLALLVYPGTLSHYALLLLVPLSWLWHERRELPGGGWGAVAVIAIVDGLLWGRLVFAAHLAAWLALTVVLAVAGARASAASPVTLAPSPAH